MQHWIGLCHLRARSTEREKWIGGRAEAVGRLLLLAGSSDDFRNAVRDGLRQQGYDLLGVLEAGPLAEASILKAKDHAQLAQILPRVGRELPIPLGDFGDVAATSWTETDWDSLFDDATPLWAVVDGVSWPGISALLWQSQAEHDCLYSTLNPESRALAPWLVRVTPGSRIASLLRAQPALAHSYVMFQSDQDLKQIRRHLRHFTMLRMQDSSDAPVYFRFYDPRVMLDMTDSVRPAFLARFMRPFRSVIVQTSPLCLFPPHRMLSGAPISPFDDGALHQGRLLRHELASSDAPKSANEALEIDPAELERFSELMAQRATIKLARRLYADHAPAVSQLQCLAAAASAGDEAARFGMTTIKQVGVIARSILMFGKNFETRHPEANRILRDDSLLPWQKKDRLTSWFAHTILRADNSAPADGTSTWTQ